MPLSFPLPLSPALSEQPVVDTATATEQAKQLVKSGAISAIKAETKNSGFKRSRTLEGKLKVSTQEDCLERPGISWKGVGGGSHACSHMSNLCCSEFRVFLSCSLRQGLTVLMESSDALASASEVVFATAAHWSARFLSITKKPEPSVVAHAFNHSTCGAEAGRFLSLRTARST